MEAIKDKIRELISPVITARDIFLVDVTLRGQPGSLVLSVICDTRTGISLDQITKLTREIGGVLDSSDVIKGGYRLEVTSPGVDRDLQELWEYERQIGRQLRVSYRSGEESKELIGKLVSVTSEAITLSHQKQEQHIPINTIFKARVQLKW